MGEGGGGGVIGSLGALAYDIVAQDKTEEGTASAGGKLEKVGVAAGVAMAAVGGAMIMFSDKYREFKSTLDEATDTMGIQKGALDDLSLSYIDADKNSEEVNNTFNELARAGVDTKEGMDEAADGFFKLADAMHTTGDEMVRDLTPAFDAFDIPLTDINEHMDTVTWTMKNSTMTMGEYSSAVTKTAPEMADLNLTFEDQNAVLQILASRGIVGKAAIKDIGDAAKNASPDLSSMKDAADKAADSNDHLGDELRIAKERLQEYMDKGNVVPSTLDSMQTHIKDLQKAMGDNNKTIDDYKTALDNSKTPQQNFYDTLHITKDDLDKASTNMATFKGKTNDFAKDAEEKHGVLDEFKAVWEKISIHLGESANQMEPLAAGLITIGPLLSGIAGTLQIINGMGGLSGALGLNSVASLAGAGTMTAAAFLGALTAGLAVGLAGIYLLVYSGALGWIGGVGKAVNDKLPWLMDIFKVLFQGFAVLGVAAIDLVTGRIGDIPGDIIKIGADTQAAARRLFQPFVDVALAVLKPLVDTLNWIAQHTGQSTAPPPPIGGGSSGGGSSGSGGTPAGGCFAAGTLVTMMDGSCRRIEEVEPLDQVQSFDPRTLQPVAGHIQAKFIHRTPILIVEFADGSTIQTTREHPFLAGQTASDERIHEKFIPAGKLWPGDTVIALGKDGPSPKRIIACREAKEQTVYNFNVLPLHTYIADGCLVHNMKTQFAEGGVVWGKTEAVIGEDDRTTPEVVAPLSTLKDLLINPASSPLASSNGSAPTIIELHVDLDGDSLAEKTMKIADKKARVRVIAR